MKQTYISLTVAVWVLLAVGVPNTSHAYFTTKQTAHAFTPTTAVFAIEYAFGLNDYDIYMPVLAERAEDGDSNKINYTLIENDDVVKTKGTTLGMAVAKLPIVDGMYKIEKGTAQKMTLYVVLTTPSDTLEDDYALQVTHLPYFVDKGGKEKVMEYLNPSELQYYLTKEIELNTGVFAN